jgi:predicted transcriptional regulator
MRSLVRIRLDPALLRKLDRQCRQLGRTRDDLIEEALIRQLALLRLDRLRRRVMPFAEMSGYLTDEDVFKSVS